MLIDDLQRLAEYSHIPPGIEDSLEEKGYKILGRGVDQVAFESPDPRIVLKIFGSSRGRSVQGRAGEFNPTEDQKMFLTWADYCNRNKNNPFLPRFYKGQGGKPWAPFVFKDRVYLQIWQERLREGGAVTRDLSELVWLIQLMGPESIMRYYQGRPTGGEDRGLVHKSDVTRMRRVANLVGESQWPQFVNTVYKLHKIAEQRGWRLDLHRNNFMLRMDGFPVINDPWHID